MLTDSDIELVSAYRFYFDRCGYDVNTSLNAHDCLDKVRKTNPNAVILEHDLATASDVAVVNQLYEECRLRSIPIVLTVGATSVENMSMLSPVLACLRKPFRMSELCDVLNSIEQDAIQDNVYALV